MGEKQPLSQTWESRSSFLGFIWPWAYYLISVSLKLPLCKMGENSPQLSKPLWRILSGGTGPVVCGPYDFWYMRRKTETGHGETRRKVIYRYGWGVNTFCLHAQLGCRRLQGTSSLGLRPNLRTLPRWQAQHIPINRTHIMQHSLPTLKFLSWPSLSVQTKSKDS